MKNKNLLIIFILLGGLVLAFSCLACGLTTYGLNRWLKEGISFAQAPVEVEVVPLPGSGDPNLSQDLQQTAHQPSSTLETLTAVDIPINDPIDIAQRTSRRPVFSQQPPVVSFGEMPETIIQKEPRAPADAVDKQVEAAVAIDVSEGSAGREVAWKIKTRRDGDIREAPASQVPIQGKMSLE